jgi:hypothetical protein
MRYSLVIKSGLLAFIPVIVTLGVWILLQAEKLITPAETLRSGFFVPSTAGEAIRSGFVIWFGLSLAVSFVCGAIYYLVTQKWHWQALYFAFLLSGLAVLGSLLAFFFGVHWMRVSTGEMLIVGIGFGVFIPWFAQRQLRDYT